MSEDVKTDAKPEKKVQKIERTAGVTTYKPREEIEIREIDLPPMPDVPKIEKATVRDIPLPEHAPGAPILHRSGGQFSLKRLVIQNVYTKQKRNISIPLNRNNLDYVDRATEIIVEQSEALYWSEAQRDAELRAFKTLIDPLASNADPHARRPPQDNVDNLINTTE